MCFAPQRRALFRDLNFQKWSEPLVFCTFGLRNVLRATTACTFSTSQLPKVVRTPSALYILISKCASRHNGVHFFDISTSKSGPNVVCFVHFDLKKCFAPQRRALFRHLNFQKCSETQVFCTFSLWNSVRATTACNFSSLIWPAGSAPAALASHKSLEKHSVSRLSYLFAHLHLLSSDSFSSTLLSSNLSLLSASALLCFSSVHIVGSLTSKLPSIKCFWESLETLGFARNSGESGFTPRTERKRPFQIEDIEYTNPKFSKQDCATKHFLIEVIRLDDPPSLCFWCWYEWFDIEEIRLDPPGTIVAESAKVPPTSRMFYHVWSLN